MVAHPFRRADGNESILIIDRSLVSQKRETCGINHAAGAVEIKDDDDEKSFVVAEQVGGGGLPMMIAMQSC